MIIKKLVVLGGSACSAAGLSNKESAWPELLNKKYPDLDLQVISVGGLTLVQSIKILNEIEKSDILILNFGTSVGWPRIVTELQDRFGIKFSSEFGFQQPLLEKDKSLIYRLKKYGKLKLKNTLKYIFAMFRMYRPKTNVLEISDQIDAVFSLASKKAEYVIWVQHRGLTNVRTKIERYYYDKFYNLILKNLKRYASNLFVVVEIPKEFDVPSNYLSDLVHLSESGHQKILSIIERQLKTI